MRVVIAEDDVAVADGLAACLRQAGHEVAVALDGEAALQQLGCRRADLLVLDYGLPKVPGAQVLQAARARAAELPVMLISALDDAEARLAHLGLHVDAVLDKPFGLSDFERCLRQLQHRDAAARRLARAQLALADDETQVLGVLQQASLDASDSDEIAHRLRERGIAITPEAVERCIDRLGDKLAACSLRIVRVRGLGYVLVESAATSVPIGGLS
jgi:two-component system OmpR family response regulator